jgi:hypothetical protein
MRVHRTIWHAVCVRTVLTAFAHAGARTLEQLVVEISNEGANPGGWLLFMVVDQVPEHTSQGASKPRNPGYFDSNSFT